LLAPTESKN